MLTHEQTTIRLRDAEIGRLKKENERLNGKVRDIKTGLVELGKRHELFLKSENVGDGK